MSLPFEGHQSWQEKVLSADEVYAKVQAILDGKSLELPKTPRRPDVRMILLNTTGTPFMFQNPGQHSDKAETIKPGEAVMVMLKGDTLSEQFAAAASLAEEFDLGVNGLSMDFVAAMRREGKALDRVAEAYGPASLEEQAAKLLDLNWHRADGSLETIIPNKTGVCASGARAATKETAFRAETVIYVKGTVTIPERMEVEGMVIAVSQDWQTKEIQTRPIVPSVAKEFYGEHYARIPVVELHPDGYVRKIDLKNGTVIDFSAPQKAAAAPVGPRPA